MTGNSLIIAEEMESLLSTLKKSNLIGKHLEIGTAFGGTLCQMMLNYPKSSRPDFVVVDPMDYVPDQLQIVKTTLETAGIAPATVDFRSSKSWDALKRAISNKERFSFIFVDGSHAMHHVTEDIGWAALLEPGGLLCFHDYGPDFPGVIEAVNRFLKRCPEYVPVSQARSLLIVHKLAVPAAREINPYELTRARMIMFVRKLRDSLTKRRMELSSKF